jgi:hypothetical protein
VILCGTYHPDKLKIYTFFFIYKKTISGVGGWERGYTLKNRGGDGQVKESFMQRL